jgi:hypothetical protein
VTGDRWQWTGDRGQDAGGTLRWEERPRAANLRSITP